MLPEPVSSCGETSLWQGSCSTMFNKKLISLWMTGNISVTGMLHNKSSQTD